MYTYVTLKDFGCEMSHHTFSGQKTLIIHVPLSVSYNKQKRAFSCVGLLATCGEEQQPGCLWLVDATGAYRCRAQAVGGGADAAMKMNEQLAKEDFDTMTTKDGARKILNLLMDKNVTNLPEETRVEVAAVGFEQSRRLVKRLTSKSLFGVKR